MKSEEFPGDSSELIDSYEKNLIRPGWAGDLSPTEFILIKAQLKQSPSLKRRWGFKPTAKRFSEDRIRAVAVDGYQRARQQF